MYEGIAAISALHGQKFMTSVKVPDNLGRCLINLKSQHHRLLQYQFPRPEAPLLASDYNKDGSYHKICNHILILMPLMEGLDLVEIKMSTIDVELNF